jgi:hypothetical protein
MEPKHNALLRFGFHNAFNDFPRLICGAVLKKCHRS